MAEKFIQSAFRKSKKAGTLGDCTGDNFGSESCPEGSRKYNFAKILHRIAKEKDRSVTTPEERNGGR